MLVAFGLSRFTFGYEIGQTVLALCGESYQKAVIVKVINNYGIKLNYISLRANEKCEDTILLKKGYFYKKILPYKSVQKYQRNIGRSNYNLEVGQTVRGQCGGSELSGVIADISSSGYVNANFETPWSKTWKSYVEEYYEDLTPDDIIGVNYALEVEDRKLKYCDGYIKFSNIIVE